MPSSPSKGPYVPDGNKTFSPLTSVVAGSNIETKSVKAKIIAGPQDHANCEIPIF